MIGSVRSRGLGIYFGFVASLSQSTHTPTLFCDVPLSTSGQRWSQEASKLLLHFPKTGRTSNLSFAPRSRVPCDVSPTHLYETYSYQTKTSTFCNMFLSPPAVRVLLSTAVQPKQSIQTSMAFVTLPPMTSPREAMAAVATASAAGREGGRGAHRALSTAWRRQQQHQHQHLRKCSTRRLLLLSPHAASRAPTTSAAAATTLTPTIMTSTARLPCQQHRLSFRGPLSLSMAVGPNAELHAADHATGQAAAAAEAVSRATAHTAEATGVQAGAASGTGGEPGGSGQAMVRHGRCMGHLSGRHEKLDIICHNPCERDT